MTETKREIKMFEVDCDCSKCNKGQYRPTGISLTSCPAQYPHECNKCGDKRTFLKIYPLIETEQSNETQAIKDK